MQLEEIENILLGIAIGDAFGAGVEFQDRNWMKATVDFTQFINVRSSIQVPEERIGLFTENYHDWEYTDDTEMTIGLINALMSEDAFSEELLVREWTNEYRKGEKEKGYGRNGHGSMSWYFSGKMAMEEIRSFQQNRPNPGNAPAMRAVPLGLISPEWIHLYAVMNANATHPHPHARIASECIARATEFMLVKQGNRSEVIDYCLRHVPLDEDYRTYLSSVNKLTTARPLTEAEYEVLCGRQPIEKPYFLDGIYGVPSDSKYTTGSVLYVLKASENAFDALKRSVLLGGDVDSVASITTGILAGKFGLGELPDFMLEKVEGVIYLRGIAQQFHAWLLKNHPRDF